MDTDLGMKCIHGVINLNLARHRERLTGIWLWVHICATKMYLATGLKNSSSSGRADPPDSYINGKMKTSARLTHQWIHYYIGWGHTLDAYCMLHINVRTTF